MDSGPTHCHCGMTPCVCHIRDQSPQHLCNLPSFSQAGHWLSGASIHSPPYSSQSCAPPQTTSLTFENVFHTTYTSMNPSHSVALNDVTPKVVNDLEPATARKRKGRTKSGARKRRKDTDVGTSASGRSLDLPTVVQPAVFGVGPVSSSTPPAPASAPAHRSLLHSGPADPSRAVVASDVWFAMVPVSNAAQSDLLPDAGTFKPSRIRPKSSHLACSFCL